MWDQIGGVFVDVRGEGEAVHEGRGDWWLMVMIVGEMVQVSRRGRRRGLVAV